VGGPAGQKVRWAVRIERGGAGVKVFIPVAGPDGWSTATATAEISLVAEGLAVGEPDWKDAAWVGQEAMIVVDPAGFVDGDFMARVRLTAGIEQVVLSAGRVRIG
jgi:hypothetical protein